MTMLWPKRYWQTRGRSRRTRSSASCVTFALEMSHPRSLRLEPMECGALRHIAHELGRLDREAKSPIRGGLRFRIVGLDLPPDLAVMLAVSLWDPKGENASRGMQQVNG